MVNLTKTALKTNISELKILNSPAGYYIGREWCEADSKFRDEYPTEPYSRNSVYFDTAHEALFAFENGYYTDNNNEF